MSSLFKRVTLPLLAVAAGTLTASLCAPARAASATWAECDVPDASYPKVIAQQVKCTVEAYNQWTNAEFHVQLLNGDESYKGTDVISEVYGPGDFYDPVGGYHPIRVVGGGTYNNWCICSGGSSGGAFNVSTGGTTYIYIPS